MPSSYYVFSCAALALNDNAIIYLENTWMSSYNIRMLMAFLFLYSETLIQNIEVPFLFILYISLFSMFMHVSHGGDPFVTCNVRNFQCAAKRGSSKVLHSNSVFFLFAFA